VEINIIDIIQSCSGPRNYRGEDDYEYGGVSKVAAQFGGIWCHPLDDDEGHEEKGTAILILHLVS
jgi:hypothetical protein